MKKYSNINRDKTMQGIIESDFLRSNKDPKDEFPIENWKLWVFDLKDRLKSWDYNQDSLEACMAQADEQFDFDLISWQLVSADAETEARSIMARALDQSAELQERGEDDKIGDLYDSTELRVLELGCYSDPSINLAFKFWDQWISASLDSFRGSDSVSRGDWPGLARRVASGIRKGDLPIDDEVVRLFTPQRKKGFIKGIRSWLFRRR